MQDFLKALVSKSKNIELPDEYNYFGKLIGSWQIDYIDRNDSFEIKRRVAFFMGS